jgi:hypothetical protein
MTTGAMGRVAQQRSPILKLAACFLPRPFVPLWLSFPHVRNQTERGLSQPAAGARAEDRSITLTSIRQRFCCGLRQAALRVKILRFFAPLHLCVFAL